MSVYHHWGLSEGKAGELDFDYYRSQTEVYEIAKEVGLLVMARPGVSLQTLLEIVEQLTAVPCSRTST